MLTTSPVRKATPADMPELMEMCRELHAENGMFPMNEGKVSAMIARALSPPVDQMPSIIGILRHGSGPIEGTIFLLVSSYWYTSEPPT